MNKPFEKSKASLAYLKSRLPKNLRTSVLIAAIHSGDFGV
jgi:hypothetical protein